MTYDFDFDIGDVADILKLNRLSHGVDSFYIECPFCGAKKTKANICIKKNGELKNVFHCFGCNRGMNMLDLYIEVAGKNITRNEACNEILSIKKGAQFIIERQKKNETKKTEIVSIPKASADILHHTYVEMLNMCSLRKTDNDDLYRRGLNDEQIRKCGFKSTPKDTIGICRKLLKKGCQLEGVPGFFLNNNNEWELNIYDKIKGYFCPVINKGKVLGIQIRLEKPFNDCKYLWLSSANKNKGCSSGSPCSFFGSPDSESVIVTEGILKSYVAFCLSNGQAIVGVPGVNSIGGLDEIFQTHHHKYMCEAYDMDKYLNPICDQAYSKEACAECKKNNYEQFCDGCCKKKLKKRENLLKSVENLNRKAMKYGLQITCYHWDYADSYWNGNIKGIDDYLLYCRQKGDMIYGRNQSYAY